MGRLTKSAARCDGLGTPIGLERDPASTVFSDRRRHAALDDEGSFAVGLG
jgi:hypothetical protein